MGFIKSSLVCLAAVLTTVTAAPTAEPIVKRGGGSCSSVDFVAPVKVGGTGTTAFCESNWGGSYVPITNLTVYSVQNDVVGIQALYSDGTQSPVYGRVANIVDAIGVNYGGNDLFSRLILYGAANSGYIQHLLVHTSAGDALNAGEPVADGLTPHEQAVGSGVLFGFSGTTFSSAEGTDLQSLSFMFLDSPVASIEVTNLQFPNAPTGDEDLQVVGLSQGHFYNTQETGTIQWQFNNQQSATQMYAFAQTSTKTFTVMTGVSLQIAAGVLIPSVQVTASTMFTWTTTYMTTTTVTTSSTVQVQWNEQGTLNPGQGVDTTAIAAVGSGTFPYTSTVTLKLKNGNQYTFPENGELTLNAISSAIVEVQQNNTP